MLFTCVSIPHKSYFTLSNLLDKSFKAAASVEVCGALKTASVGRFELQ